MLKKGVQVVERKFMVIHNNVISSEVGLSVSTSMNSNQAASGIWLLYHGGESGKNMSVTRFVIICCKQGGVN